MDNCKIIGINQCQACQINWLKLNHMNHSKPVILPELLNIKCYKYQYGRD